MGQRTSSVLQIGTLPRVFSLFVLFKMTFLQMMISVTSSACNFPQDVNDFFDINLSRTYNYSITNLAKQQDFLLFVVTGT